MPKSLVELHDEIGNDITKVLCDIARDNCIRKDWQNWMELDDHNVKVLSSTLAILKKAASNIGGQLVTSKEELDSRRKEN